jgi:hypothetical protein
LGSGRQERIKFSVRVFLLGNWEWWEMPTYRYRESYQWKEETEKWSSECLIRYSTVPCYNDDFRQWK